MYSLAVDDCVEFTCPDMDSECVINLNNEPVCQCKDGYKYSITEMVCKQMCPKGSYSQTGTSPCELCPLGKYQV